jgi:hypothetical protein
MKYFGFSLVNIKLYTCVSLKCKTRKELQNNFSIRRRQRFLRGIKSVLEEKNHYLILLFAAARCNAVFPFLHLLHKSTSPLNKIYKHNFIKCVAITDYNTFNTAKV